MKKMLMAMVAAGALMCSPGVLMADQGTATAPAASGQDDGALLNALVKKGVLSSKEADEISADMAKQESTSAASKIGLGSYVQKLTIFGDLRARYEYRSGTSQLTDAGAVNEQTRVRNRARYRLRVGATEQFADDFSATVRVETSSSAQSTNVTMADDAGVGGKASDAVYIGQAFLTWTPSKSGMDVIDKHITINVGKMPQPFVASNMIWDDDINPDGISEKGTWKIEDGKDNYWTVGFTTAQIVYQTRDDLTQSGFAGGWEGLLGWQANVRYNWEKSSYVDVNPTIYNYVGKNGNNNVKFTGQTSNLTGAGTTTTANDLLVFDAPISVVFPVWKHSLKLFSDTAYNFEAGARKQGAIDTMTYNATFAAPTYVTNLKADHNNEATAWRVGSEYGESKKKGDWLFGGWYGQTGLFSVDNDLNDSDLMDNRVNFAGFDLYAQYLITDNVSAKVNYAQSSMLKSGLPTGDSFSADTVSGSLKDYRLFQADLSVKF